MSPFFSCNLEYLSDKCKRQRICNFVRASDGKEASEVISNLHLNTLLFLRAHKLLNHITCISFFNSKKKLENDCSFRLRNKRNLTDSSCAVGPQAQRTRTILGVQSHRTLYSHCKKKKGKKENERESKGMNVLFKIFIFVVFMFVIFLNFFSFSYFFKCRMRTSVY